MKRIAMDEKAFTGLEAAIVLTAFVVVAAVFSYVVLGAGFFTTQKAKEVVATGVDQATSSVELAGDMIGHGWTYNGTGPNWTLNYYYNSSAAYEHDSDRTNLTAVELYLALTAGRNPVDISELVISYTDRNTHNGSLALENGLNASKANISMPSWNYTMINGDGDSLLEFGEQAKIIVALPDYGVTANKEFTVEIKPAQGAILTVTRKAPAAIDLTVNLR